MVTLFGWDLPPGVTQRDIDNAYGEYQPDDWDADFEEIFADFAGQIVDRWQDMD